MSTTALDMDQTYGVALEGAMKLKELTYATARDFYLPNSSMGLFLPFNAVIRHFSLLVQMIFLS